MVKNIKLNEKVVVVREFLQVDGWNIEVYRSEVEAVKSWENYCELKGYEYNPTDQEILGNGVATSKTSYAHKVAYNNDYLVLNKHGAIVGGSF